MIDLKAIDKSWTLFLDRDGVINHEKKRTIFLTGMSFNFMMALRKPENTER